MEEPAELLEPVDPDELLDAEDIFDPTEPVEAFDPLEPVEPLELVTVGSDAVDVGGGTVGSVDAALDPPPLCELLELLDIGHDS